MGGLQKRIALRLFRSLEATTVPSRTALDRADEGKTNDCLLYDVGGGRATVVYSSCMRKTKMVRTLLTGCLLRCVAWIVGQTHRCVA